MRLSHGSDSGRHCAADLRSKKAFSFQRPNFAAKFLNYATTGCSLYRGVARLKCCKLAVIAANGTLSTPEKR